MNDEDEPDEARAPAHAREGEWWLVFETGRYLADAGARALDLAFAEFRGLGLVAEPYDGRDDCLWLKGPKPPLRVVRAFEDYLHPPDEGHAGLPIRVEVRSSTSGSP